MVISEGVISPKYGDLVMRHREELQAQGVTTLPGLVTQSALDTAVREVENKALHTTRSPERTLH